MATRPAAGSGTQETPLPVSAKALRDNLLTRPDPVYPFAAKEAHVQGSVVLHAIISKTGTVETLNVVSGPSMLTASAMDAVKRWTYKPYLLNGQPTEVDTTITVNFTFGDAAAPLSPARGQDGAPLRVSSGTMAGNLDCATRSGVSGGGEGDGRAGIGGVARGDLEDRDD
jgi:TonB family protein